MFGKHHAASMINRSAENDQDRRRFLRAAGMTGLGVVGAGALGGLTAGSAAA
ncbi:ferritin-like domain-containing protein, partial [Amycolatopsis sp. NPDC059235]